MILTKWIYNIVRLSVSLKSYSRLWINTIGGRRWLIFLSKSYVRDVLYGIVIHDYSDRYAITPHFIDEVIRLRQWLTCPPFQCREWFGLTKTSKADFFSMLFGLLKWVNQVQKCADVYFFQIYFIEI